MTRKPSTGGSKPARTPATKPAPKPGTAATTNAAAKPAPKPKPAAAARPTSPTAADRATSATALTILLIRHADAGDSAAWVGSDAERPLSKKGRKQAKRLGTLLERLNVRPDVVLTSPRVRAADTAALVGRRIGREPKVEPRLDAGFGAEALGSLVAELDPTASMLAIVGHDPDFSVLASWLVDAPIAMAKGALVRVDLPDRVTGPGTGTLQWLLPPDAVPS